jgi:UPF0176 protein
MTYDIHALYHFGALPHFAELRAPLYDLCKSHDVMGILLVAHEGVNGTLAGRPDAMRAVIAGIKDLTGFDDLETKISHAPTMPFLRLKVRLKKEIVTIGDLSVDPTARVGTYVEPSDWDELISDPDVVLIDTRNDFEVRIGTFEGAIDPKTTSFGEFPAYVKEHLNPKQHKKIAMFCTGGIRCEKASSFMLQQGFEQVYHLKGGILKYLETVPADKSKWQGDCFVFDRRIGVSHGLRINEDLSQCGGCRTPLTAQDRASNTYELGVSCPYCFHLTTAHQKQAARERHKQMQLARARGKAHLGPRDDDELHHDDAQDIAHES